MLKDDPDRLLLDYTRTMMGFLLFNPKPKKIAMIGLGGGSIAKYCHRRLPGADFTTIELAPEVIALRGAFGIPEDSERFRILCADGADFVKAENNSLDVLLVDGFDFGGQPSQLCSTEFYGDCYRALRSGGILVVNLCANDNAHRRYTGRIKAAFHDRAIGVAADEGDNAIVFASKNERGNDHFPPSFNELSARLRTLESAHPTDLAQTAQKILGHGMPNKGRR